MKNLLKKSMVVSCMLLCNGIMASSSEELPPQILQYPKVKTGICGQDVVWNLKAIGTPAPTFLTYFENIPIESKWSMSYYRKITINECDNFEPVLLTKFTISF